MISTFTSKLDHQRLSILDYDVTKTNVRYKAVINEDQVAVLHLQSVDTEVTPNISQLFLCPGVLESAVPFESCSDSTRFLIEKAEDEIVYRSRNCSLVYSCSSPNILCESCQDLFSLLNVHIEAKMDEAEEGEEDIKSEFGFDPEELSNIKITPIVIRIKKDETCLPEVTSGEEEKRSRAPRVRSLTFPCPECDRKFPSRYAARRHAKKTHGHSKCPFCALSFIKDSPRWPPHLINHHQNEKENPLYQEILKRVEVEEIICQLCGLGFRHISGFSFHMRTVHNCQTNTYPCSICGKLLKNKNNLAMHEKTHPEVQSESFLCMQCGSVMKSKQTLEDHIERFHSGKEKVICAECGRQFRTRKDLIRHIRNLHTPKERTFECAQCDKRFFHLVDLKNHVALIHEKTNPKPWHCEVCPFKASRLGNLNQHRRKTHSKGNISRARLLEMVENDLHPSYTRDDLHLVQQGIN